MDEVYAYAVELPAKVKGVTVRKNGDYIVFINSLLCEEAQRKALKHELFHIKKDHLFNECIMAVQCEKEAASQ